MWEHVLGLFESRFAAGDMEAAKVLDIVDTKETEWEEHDDRGGLLNDFAQELGALLNKMSIFLGMIASLEHDAEYDKNVAEMEWPDLMLFSNNQLTEIDEQLVLLAGREEALLRSFR